MKKKLKKISAAVSCVVTVTTIFSAAFADTKYFYDGNWHNYTYDPIKLMVNGENVQGDISPILFNNSTVVPARQVFEKLGAVVNWDSQKAMVDVKLDDKDIVLNIDKTDALVNGTACNMPIAPKIVNNRTMIPVRFVAETLGFKVNWIEKERIVSIDKSKAGDIGINDVHFDNNASSMRLTISASDVINDYNSFELNDPSRLVVDIKNSVLGCNGTFSVNNSCVSGVRTAQNNKNPNITRVVMDLNQWTAYKVSLSQDKKQMYVDFDNKPVEVNTVKFSTSGDTDIVDLNVKYSGNPVIETLDKGTNIILDIPMASVKSQSIDANGKFVNKVECSELNSNTARVVISVSKSGLLETENYNGGVRFKISSPEKSYVQFLAGTNPQLILKNDRIGANYFNYKSRLEGNTFILSMASAYFDISSAKLITGDSNIPYVDITKKGSLLEFAMKGTKPLSYRSNSGGSSNELIVTAYPNTSISTDRGNASKIDPRIKEKIVVIDPGHGGSESGAASGKLEEKNVNLDISLRLYNMLKGAGINVYLTRNTDQYVDLNVRGDNANKLNASLFVSVHNNSGDAGENGTMTLYYPGPYNPNYSITAERAAQIVQEELLRNLGTTDRGIWKRPRLAVLNCTKMPSILAEVAYISDNTDRQKLLTDSFKNQAAQGIYNGIIRSLTEMVNNQNGQTTINGDSLPKPAYTNMQGINLNGFNIPLGAKCDYRGGSASDPSIFDFGIQLDYSKQTSGTATLDEQRNEARQVLSSKLEQDAVNKIMDLLSMFNSADTHIWEDEMESKEYKIWVKCIRGTGKATVELIHK